MEAVAVPAPTQTHTDPVPTTVAPSPALPVSTDGAATATPPAPQRFSVREYEQSLNQRPTPQPATPPAAATDATPAPEADAAQPRDPVTGQFLPAAEQAAGTDGPAPDEAGSDAPLEADAEAPADDGLVRIKIGPDHPLRANGRYQGPDEIPVPPELEVVFRNALNDPIRRADVENARQTVRQTETQLVEAQATLDVLKGALQNLITNPDLTAVYQDLKQAYGDERANEWLAGQFSQYDSQVEQRLGEYQQQRQAQDAAEAGVQFVSQAAEAAQSYFPEWWTSTPQFAHAFRAAVDEYDRSVGYRMQAGDPRPPSVEEFVTEVMKARYLSDPAVLDYAAELDRKERAEAAERLKQEAKREVEAETRARLEQQARTAQQNNPLGAVPSGQVLRTAAGAGTSQVNARAFDRLMSRRG